jgi:hypothetical protein
MAAPSNIFTTSIRLPSSIFTGKLSLVNVITRVHGIRQLGTFVSFFFYLICFVTDERAYIVQAGRPGALSVCEAVQ